MASGVRWPEGPDGQPAESGAGGFAFWIENTSRQRSSRPAAVAVLQMHHLGRALD